MKNLKRVLSLGLASVMLLGMMVVGASAKDFTDAADITHAEAVETLVALKIVAGKEDGSYFDPKGNVTRGEMAKMITVAMQGGSETNTGVKGTPSFTDIKGHWAEPYIEYCYDLGIISGRGDGTFDPNGNVTGLEAAKMVLTALGYEAEAYKLNGASWATRTDEVARTSAGKSLYENLGSITMSAPATRDSAAQLIWNGLQAYVVTVRPGQNKNNGEVTWNYDTKGEVTLLKQRYDANVMLATFDGNKDFGASGALKGEIGVTSKRATKVDDTTTISSGSTFIFPAEMDIDNIAEEVKVVWKNGEKSSSVGPDKNDVIYGVFNTGATRVVRSQLSKIKDNKVAKNQINIDGTKYDTTSFVDVVYNYAKTVSAKANAGSDSNSDLTVLLKHNSGWPIKAVFDDNGKIDTIYVTQTYLGVVTAVNSTNISINNGVGILKIADHDIEEGLEKNDIVAVTPLYWSTKCEDGVTTVRKAEKVSGTVTGWKADENITMDGKTYKINYKNGSKNPIAKDRDDDVIPGPYIILTDKNGDGDTSDPGESETVTNPTNVRPAGISLNMLDTAKFTNYEDLPVDTFNGTGNDHIDKEFDLYLVDGYVMAAIQTDEKANNYSVITEVKTGTTITAGTTFDALQLQVMGADGTKEIITVSKDSKTQRNNGDGTYTSLTHDTTKTGTDKKTTVTNKDYSVGDIITYTFDKNDEADVTMEAKVAGGTLNYSEKAQTVGSAVTAANCVIFVQTDNTDTANINMLNTLSGNRVVAKISEADFEVYDIRSLDSINLSGVGVSVATDSNTGKVVAVFLNKADTPDGAEDDTVYGIVSAYNGRIKDYYSYVVQSNGEEYTVNMKSSTGATVSKGDLVSFRPTADDVYSAAKITVYTSNLKDKEQPADSGTYVADGRSGHDTIVKPAYGYVKEYSASDNALTYWQNRSGSGSAGYTGSSPKTYALDKDCKIIYVDQDNDESVAESSITEFSEITGRCNMAFLTKEVDGVEVIKALFVEVSGEANIDNHMRVGNGAINSLTDRVAP